MNKFIALACAAIAAFTAVALTGCSEKKYYFYTNVPSAFYTVSADNYKLGAAIGGCTADAFTGTAAPAASSGGFTEKSHIFYSMDTFATLEVKDDFTDVRTAEKYDSMLARIEDLLTALENSFSAHSETSYIYAFNEAAPGEKVEIDLYTYELLSVAKYIYGLTDGYYNPAVYYSVKAYGFYDYYVPSANELPGDGDTEKYAQLSEHFGEVVLTDENGAYYAVKPSASVDLDGEQLSLKIDLGGIGKGYAADKVNALLDAYGFAYGYFNFGQSSVALKSYVSLESYNKSGNYTLSLTSPRGDGCYVKLSVGNVCVSSSGDYEQYYTIGGVRYCHIIDPTTGKPIQTGIMTATVIGGSAAEDDALTTALMAMGRDRAIEFTERSLTDRYVVFTYDGVK